MKAIKTVRRFEPLKNNKVMKENNLIRDKAFAFSIRIVKLSQYLVSEQREFVPSKQILKSGTSIGANLAEAEGGQSKADI